jgi:DNA-binding PadR family transcriptional regulator
VTPAKLDPEKFLPLTEATYYILLALAEPLHGYGVMQKVALVSEASVNLGPGTLYGAFSQLEGQKLIEKVREEDRRKVYQLTALGRQVLAAQLERLELMVRNGREVVDAQRMTK